MAAMLPLVDSLASTNVESDESDESRISEKFPRDIDAPKIMTIFMEQLEQSCP
jgi:hypothetical protein